MAAYVVQGTEIRAAFWGSAVDMFFDVLPTGTVATFTGGKVLMPIEQYVPPAVRVLRAAQRNAK